MEFTDLDKTAVNTIRLLAADTVQKANSGHPGAPMGCAPMTHVLYSRFMKQSPANSKWFARDRFVLSNGHACALLYSMLHLCGYKVNISDLQQFRQLNSITPGHPEVHVTDGIEVCTGPLGQGICNAVGLAMAETHMKATFNREGFPIIDNYTYCIVGDGCLQEGVSSEASSLAGHLGLGNLIVLYDDNKIQIDGSTEHAFTEDVLKRYEAYGWHTLSVADGDTDLKSIAEAIEIAKSVKDKPTLIKITTVIGYGAKLQGTEKVHGAPLGADDLASVKKRWGFDPERSFFVPEDVKRQYADLKERGAKAEAEWNALFQRYAAAYPQLAAELQRRINGELPANWKDCLPRFTANDPANATRKLSEACINAFADQIPEFVGGSADLEHSNLVRWKTAVDYQRDGHPTGQYSGRYMRFGVREHGMAAICNGLAAYGALIPMASTFLNFIGYAQGAFRLSALSNFRIVYVMTHDGIGLGEDGPTHQQIEVLALIRATPNILLFRPADGNETSGTYVAALENKNRPTVMCLTRQNLPQLEGSSIENTLKGGYKLQDMGDQPQIVLVGSGSEVSLCVDAAKLLTSEGIHVRIVSMPCMELFEEQSAEYKASVFPVNVPVMSVEACTTFGWAKYAHASVGLDTFGASAPYKDVYKKFGLVPPVVAEKAKRLLLHFRGQAVQHLVARPF
eukprot:Partr_v1_DN26235_c0_g1_i1_m48613 putative Transketolase